MSKLVVSTFLTLDGVMQGPGGPGEDDSNGFRHGGWLVPHVDEEFGQIMADQLTAATGMLLGRRSYDILSAHWPNVPDEEGGALINGMAKYVATRSPLTPAWNNTEVLVGDAAQTVADLKKCTDGELLVQGSSDLIATLQRADLIDEYRLLTFPVVLGEGKRLFAAGAAPANLRLTAVSSTPAGVVYSVYRRTGDLAYGTVSPNA
ncbi:dihydrofolate reductase family protein [Actinomadura macrotermitis]|uniref:Bacterial bifunctional deaminase-reductase C-terminal domain-containing protein n=1 Tax=Actinomadura macrotermitis TaxID=2585200 RepID=A0A7K0BY97_9ACTN|nr:dihydrofolate reductase family protein [Actinomadura macrotermitis]MQY05832.1 putative protein YyaP [Actinomadura macrotermitis]